MRNLGKLVLAAALAAGLSACGSSDQASTGSSGGASIANLTTTASAPVTTTASNLPACTVDDVQTGGEPGAKPTITIPDTCSPPKELLSKDLVVGTGKDVTAGVTMQTHYLLVTWSDKVELDNSWDRGETFPLENVGQARVIEGWNEGVIGMKEGGRRLLVIPPDKGYGQGGNGIAPNETLVFVVDAVSVS